MTEAVECCPWCEAENTYTDYDAEESGYIQRCTSCGQLIFLCDECKHASDNPTGMCDWTSIRIGDRMVRGECRRGRTVNSE